ncbi:MAG: helix-turn-helix transcriptional regulator [Candidatus Dormibacteraeota bacterium]|nr:helix-turn-helix transcriptional regulator [Candidatus Dormibacteraeota bacterium]MBO0761203.1 helix-turn-helix transcriptional regulator [Candidatus Dormibacteraeota bacterium]
MSNFEGARESRRRRRDAERSAAAVLESAVRVLNERPAASMGDIAEAAGLTRQTVYAHFPSREALLGAVIEHATEEALEAMDAAELDRGPAAAALGRLLQASWQTFTRYPILLHLPDDAVPAAKQEDQHGPVLDRLDRLIRRGQAAGEFDDRLSSTWLLAATLALGHAAGGEVAAGRMRAEEASATLWRSLLRIFGAQEPPADQPR